METGSRNTETVSREEGQTVSGKTLVRETVRSRPEGGQPVRAPASDTTLEREAEADAVGDVERHRRN